MFIPYYIFLLIYLLGVVLFFLFGFFNMYHIFRFGVMNTVTVTMSLLFVVVSAVILIVSAWYISQIPWLERITLEFFVP